MSVKEQHVYWSTTREVFGRAGLLGRGWDIRVIVISSDEQGDESIMSVAV